MNDTSTRMHGEAAQAPACVARQALEVAEPIARVARELKLHKPLFLATIARGSSDHAATYAKYLIETSTGVPVTSYAPSVSSLYESRSTMHGAACIAISQSGRSPDLVSSLHTARTSGALTIAIVNDARAPLALQAEHVLPLCADPETAVAATKSFLSSLAMTARIIAAWSEDRDLTQHLADLPQAMERAWSLDWSRADSTIVQAPNMFVIGRGVGLGIAQEAALKLKETCRIHAEAYSAAEVLHGPAAVIRSGFPVLAFVQDDASAASIIETCARLAQMGAKVVVAGAKVNGCINLPAVEADPRLQPILMAQSFYRLVNRCAVALGEDPDAPPHLMKVTETT